MAISAAMVFPEPVGAPSRTLSGGVNESSMAGGDAFLLQSTQALGSLCAASNQPSHDVLASRFLKTNC
ncbi:hypothetical protein EYF80_018717 [Liparis tanakae]|uniref:Uncharacterized protein n=1 Tax=Liparis tanakae TaxID=230148 RepID=A0A4Z2HZ35_9TELE|nr:hypothetical protein EYF80_018717 [Liparis tanakae]